MTQSASPPLILASTSASRRMLLANAGLRFTAVAANVDERALEAGLAGAGPEEIARVLSEAKALAVSARRPGSLVIGADQTLGLAGRSFHKPASSGEARAQLTALRGATHRLHSGVACALDGAIVYSHVSVAEMTMRAFSDDFLDWYLGAAGDKVLLSVGCYQLEGPGIQLFEGIDGDYFTILGMPLLPLLGKLRELGLIDV